MRALQILILLIPHQNHPILSMHLLPSLTPIKIAGMVAVFQSLLFLASRRKEKKEGATAWQGRFFLIFALFFFRK